MSARPTVSAVMPVYNGRGFIERSLPPLLAMAERGEILEVLVADDGSTDGSGEWAAERGARVVPTGGREGPARARNLAVREARGDVVWFVDADVVVHDDAVAPLVRAFDDEAVVAVFGSYDDEPPYEGFASQYMNLRHHFVHHRHGGEAATFWSGCGAVRREVFERVGGFDADTYGKPSIEDIELGYRLCDTGGRIVVDPALQGTHLKEWSLWGVVHTDVTCRAIPWSRLLMRRPDVPLTLNTGRGEQVKAVLAGAFGLAVLGAATTLLPWWAPVVAFAVVATVDAEFFAMFRRRRGIGFAVGALAFHQLHLVYSAAVFAYCWLEHKLGLAPRAA